MTAVDRRERPLVICLCVQLPHARPQVVSARQRSVSIRPRPTTLFSAAAQHISCVCASLVIVPEALASVTKPSRVPSLVPNVDSSTTRRKNTHGDPTVWPLELSVQPTSHATVSTEQNWTTTNFSTTRTHPCSATLSSRSQLFRCAGSTETRPTDPYSFRNPPACPDAVLHRSYALRASLAPPRSSGPSALCTPPPTHRRTACTSSAPTRPAWAASLARWSPSRAPSL